MIRNALSGEKGTQKQIQTVCLQSLRNLTVCHLLALGCIIIWFLLPNQTRSLGTPTPMQSRSPYGTTPTFTPAPECEDFVVVPSLDGGSGDNYLSNVTVLSADDVWVVGQFDGQGNYSTRSLVEHWDGTAWSIVPSPDPPDAANVYPSGLSAVSPDDIWAVGSYEDADLDTKTFTMHWDGMKWSLVPSPNPGTTWNFLYDVSAVSSNNVWAVGNYQDVNGVMKTLTLYWDGVQWSRVASPNPSGEGNSYLKGVDALSASDIWAVGYIARPGGTLDEAITMHWNGTAWSIVPTPAIPSADVYLNRVSARTGSDVWAVGRRRYAATNDDFTLTLRWNSTAWSIVPSPNPAPTARNILYGIEAVSDDDAWAVGYYMTATVANGSPAQPLVTHWDGVQWSVAPPPQGTIPSYKYLYAVAALSSSDIWLAGYNESAGPRKTYTAHYDGTLWTHVPSPNTGIAMSRFQSVDGASPNDLWAVGEAGGPLIEHWDGAQWSITPHPETEIGTIELRSVSVRAPNDVWAVGTKAINNVETRYESVTMHWDGAQWSIVPSPQSGGDYDHLEDVDALAANAVWAVGSSNSGSLILFWNGSQWQVVPNSLGGSLSSVTALSPTDVWAVGSKSIGGVYQTLVARWDGVQWSVVPSPNPAGSGRDHYLSGVSAVPGNGNDIWAVGQYEQPDFSYHTLTLHWDGQSWTHVPSPNVPNYFNYLYDVSARSAGDVWAAGMYHTGYGLVMHWDGGGWSIVSSATPDEGASLAGIVALSAQEVWAVGWSGFSTLTERYVGICPTPTRTPTSTVTSTSTPSNTPTITRTPTRTNTPTITLTPTPTCQLQWRIQQSEYPGKLKDVWAYSEDDIWAIGNIGHPTLIMHWDGEEWSVVPSPNPGPQANILNSISGSGPDDVWAVGYLFDGSNNRTLILHWDGVQWSVVSSPNVGPTNSELWSVSALSKTDAWAVGDFSGAGPGGSLTLHWDGTDWSVVPSPSFEYHCYLNKVVALAEDNVWAVGSVYTGGGPWPVHKTLVLHWDGQAWNRVPSPNLYQDHNVLLGLWAASPDDMWAVGEYNSEGWFRTLTMHWDGSTWTIVPSPNVGNVGNILWNVDGVSTNDVWAVGYYNTGRATLALHWDGQAWAVVSTPNVEGMKYQDLAGVVALSPTNVWAVGHYAWPVEGTLIEQYSNPCSLGTPTANPTLSPTPSPTPTISLSATVTSTSTSTSTLTGTPFSTATPQGSTATALTRTPSATPTGTELVGTITTIATIATTTVTAIVTATNHPNTTATRAMTVTTTPTATATATGTACLVQFSDVPEGSTFYPFVRCLACRGIVSGYPDGTFRPSEYVTRGQIAKIVSNAAGFSEAHVEQTFEDVSVGHNFYIYIERLASRAILAGYPCGGASEPCVAPQNRPYFRPANNATRGQLSKIVCRAYNCTGTTNEQTFEDVPPGSTYYEDIEHLYALGAINGYPCGGSEPPEPCIPPQNRPYFRLGYSVTRGQTAKIVSNTFFPGCQPTIRK